MKLGNVIATVVATKKHPAFTGHTLLLVQPIDETGSESGDAILAVDHAQAGIGDCVLINQEGGGSRQLLGTVDGKLPIRSVIVGIVDAVDAGASLAAVDTR